MRTPWLLLTVLTAAVLTGCTSPGDSVDTKSEADVTAAVRRYADEVKAVTGGDYTLQKPSRQPCTGKLGESSDDVFSVQGAYQVPLAPEKQLPTLAQLRDQWKAKGWKITEDTTTGATSGNLSASTGDNGYTVSLATVTDPQWLAILVHSPCFKSPSPS